MNQARLGGLTVGRIGLGTMGMSAGYAGTDEAECIRTIHRAIDTGADLLDTAEVYGPHVNEELVGRALKGRRDQVVLATKFGYMSNTGRPPPDSSPENIRIAIEGSLRRLRTDHVDLYYQHRVDPKVPIEEVIGTLSDLVAEGKAAHLGLSEASADTLRRAHAVHPIAALQSEYSLWTRDPEGKLLPVLRELGIGFVAYSPLGHGLLTGAIRSLDDLHEGDWRKTNPRFTEGNFQRNLAIADEIRVVASEADATPAQVALAWLVHQGEDIVPLPGSERVAWLDENLAAQNLQLTPGQLARLDRLTPAAGDHHDSAQTQLLDS